VRGARPNFRPPGRRPPERTPHGNARSSVEATGPSASRTAGPSFTRAVKTVGAAAAANMEMKFRSTHTNAPLEKNCSLICCRMKRRKLARGGPSLKKGATIGRKGSCADIRVSALTLMWRSTTAWSLLLGANACPFSLKGPAAAGPFVVVVCVKPL